MSAVNQLIFLASFNLRGHSSKHTAAVFCVGGSLDAGHLSSLEVSFSSTFYVVQREAQDGGVVDLALRLAPPLERRGEAVRRGSV